jgi:uncharacterized membrane protein SpoIIM required for sporulation
MHTDEFYESRKADWAELTRLLERCKGSVNHLSPEEVRSLGQLYRLVTSDLALAQRDFPDNRVTQYLNQLVARAHAVVYQSEPLAYQRIWWAITVGYPQAYRQAGRFILLAFLLFAIPALVVGMSTAWQPSSARWLLPADVQRLIPMIEQQELWTDIPVWERPYISAFIMQNNIRVAFLGFASGVTAGLLTTYVMVFNGLELGGLTGLTLHYGVGFDLWTFVIGHGVVELSVIFIAGGCGLMLGWAIIHPGLHRRRDALMLAAQKAVRLIVGCVPLLMFAGLIEGFISPSETIPWFVKWSVGIGSGILLYSYLLLAGRD